MKIAVIAGAYASAINKTSAGHYGDEDLVQTIEKRLVKFYGRYII